MNTEFEVPKETPEERIIRKEREDRRWNKQWAMDKSVEWCKHINEIVAIPNNNVNGSIMTSEQVLAIADIFYEWLYKE